MDRDLSKNDLSGDIPHFLADMKMLTLVWVSAIGLLLAFLISFSYVVRTILFFFHLQKLKRKPEAQSHNSSFSSTKDKQQIINTNVRRFRYFYFFFLMIKH